MEKFVFYNFESKNNITVPLNKRKIVYIYGGNGTGKTTFSREFKEKVKKAEVFNIDFVNKNVFVVDSEGAKTDALTKENFSNLFVSEEAVQLAKEAGIVKEFKKTAEIKTATIYTKFLQTTKLYEIPFSQTLGEFLKKVEFDNVGFNHKKSEDENLAAFKIKAKLKTSIGNDDELNISISMYKSSEIIRNIHTKLNETPLLKSIFIDRDFLVNLNKKINIYNANFEILTIVEEKFKECGDVDKVREWIKQGLNLHYQKSSCIFCFTAEIEDAKESWSKIIENKSLLQKQETLSEINNTIEVLKKHILSQENIFNQLIPKIINSSKEIISKLDEIIKAMKNNEQIKLIEMIIDTDDIAKETIDVYNDVVNYLINKDIEKYLFPFAYLEFLKKLQEEFEEAANKSSEKFAEDTKEHIKIIGEKLGLSKEITIVNETRKGGAPKLSLIPGEKGMKIRDFSEGQRHKLALAVFFAKVMENKDKLDFLVLDDPILSLDIVTFHKLKKFVINDLTDKYTNLIVLTHNLSFLLIMLSNIFRKKELFAKTKLLELSTRKCEDVPIETLLKDDVVLFRDSIKNTETIGDVSLWNWLVLKVARYFLDLKLSLKSIVSFEDTKDVLPKLFEGKQLKIMRKKMDYITKTSKSPNSTISNIVISLRELNEFVSMLGFGNVIDDEDIENIKNKFKNDETIILEPVPKNLEFKILYEGYVAVTSGSKGDNLLRSYIMHPRHQITESLVAFQAQRDF